MKNVKNAWMFYDAGIPLSTLKEEKFYRNDSLNARFPTSFLILHLKRWRWCNAEFDFLSLVLTSAGNRKICCKKKHHHQRHVGIFQTPHASRSILKPMHASYDPMLTSIKSIVENFFRTNNDVANKLRIHRQRENYAMCPICSMQHLRG